MKKHFMAVDAGTGSVRAVIFDQNFSQVSVASNEWTHPEDPRFPGAIDFDVRGNADLMFDAIRRAIADAGIEGSDIVAVSTTSMREGFVLYDEDGRELWAVSNVDARAINQVEALHAQAPGLEAEAYALTGQTFSLGAIPRLLWVKEVLPDIYERTVGMSMLNDWAAYRLGGVVAVEPSNGSTSGLIAAATRDWDSGVIERCGLKTGIYPAVRQSGTALGHVTKEASVLTGLSEDCLVVVGGGDVQLGSVGVGAVEEGQAALFGGSFWQLEYVTSAPKIDNSCRIRVNCHAVPGTWQQELIAFFPGLVTRWFRDAFGGDGGYAALNAEAEAVPPGSHGTMCSFSAVMDYQHWKHPTPSFTGFGIDPDRYGRGTFYRSILENAALVTLGHKTILEETFGAFPDHLVFAAGASKSPLWCQIVADVLEVDVAVPEVKEATALGAAFCAAVGAGVLPDFSATRDYVRVESTYRPNRENGRVYRDVYEKWKQVSGAQMRLSENGIADFLWRAPGVN